LSRAALAGDEFAFAGYHRWQINDRWDVLSTREPVTDYEREVRSLDQTCRSLLAGDCAGRLRAGSYKAPPSLAASLAFRRYLAQRDVFVRRAAAAVFQLRRMLINPVAASASEWIGIDNLVAGARGCLKRLRIEASIFDAAIRAGRAAARAMWRRSRDPRTRGPNELMIERDAGRLWEWQEWLGRVERNPELAWQATPVCGAWQLLFAVHNFAPAMQKVVVEQQQADGAWVTLYGLYTIEFRAEAARPRTNISREFSVPVPLAASAGAETAEMPKAGSLKAEEGFAIFRFPSFPILPAPIADARGCGGLRLAVRGIGQVAVSDVELTNGVERWRPEGWPHGRRRFIGRPASLRGFPKADFEQNTGAMLIASWRRDSDVSLHP
jgi:hypothetical protein